MPPGDSPQASRPWLNLLLDGVVRLGKEVLHDRVEALGEQWTREKNDILQTLLRAALALMLLGLGSVMWMAWLVLTFWDSHGLLVLAGLGTALCVVGAWQLERLRWQLQRSAAR